MPIDCDVVIAGAGLAGACAAFQLSRDRRVMVLEAGEPASGASGVAAGIANPLMSLWARPVWRMEEAMAALHEITAAAGAEHLVRRDGLLRPAANRRQAESFEQVSREFPRHADWLSPDASAERFPDVHAPLGALWNGTAIALSIPVLVGVLLKGARTHGAIVRSGAIVMGWRDEGDRVGVDVGRPGGPADREVILARTLLLALGRDYHDFQPLRRLRLHPVKGQLVCVSKPAGLEHLPHVAGRGYVMVEEEALLLGSTYEHQFCDLNPDRGKTREIVRAAIDVVPAIEGAAILEERAGVRVTVPGIRLPMVGPLPENPNVWIFTGLGSKGLLMAPLVARDLPGFIVSPESIPNEIRVRDTPQYDP